MTANFKFEVFSILDDVQFASQEFYMTEIFSLCVDSLREIAAAGESEESWQKLAIIDQAVQAEISYLCS